MLCTLRIVVSSMLLIAEWKINYEVKLLKYPQNLFLYYFPISKLHFFIIIKLQSCYLSLDRKHGNTSCVTASELVFWVPSSHLSLPLQPVEKQGCLRDNWYESHYPLEEIILSQICFSSMSVVSKPYVVLCEFYIGLIPPKFNNLDKMLRYMWSVAQ